MDTCSNCKFWDYADRDGGGIVWGFCRFNPPQTSSSCVVSKRNLWSGQWPGTKANDWCGSFASTEQAHRFQLGSPLISGKDETHG